MSKLLSVQILRGLAALSVAALHAQADASALAARAGTAFAPRLDLPFAAGVDVFFVISGLIMVHASRPLFGRPGAAGLFLSRRVARIVPLYWAVTLLYLAVALAAPGLLNSAILAPWPVVASFLFIPFARPDGAAQPLYSLGWTLNYEMFFYALFAIAVTLPRRIGVPALVAALAALVALGRAGAWPQPVAFWTGPILLEFAFGLLIGLVRAEGVALPGAARLGLAAGGVLLLVLPEAARPGAVSDLSRPFVWGLPAALIVAAAALGPERERGRTALTRAAVAVGDASYALYLLHPFAIRGVSAAVGRAGLGSVVPGWAYVALALAAATLAALAVHLLLERPATAWLRDRLTPRSRAPGR